MGTKLWTGPYMYYTYQYGGVLSGYGNESLPRISKRVGLHLMLWGKVRLVPVISCNKFSLRREIIWSCQEQHKQILDSLNIEYHGLIKLQE